MEKKPIKIKSGGKHLALQVRITNVFGGKPKEMQIIL